MKKSKIALCLLAVFAAFAFMLSPLSDNIAATRVSAAMKYGDLDGNGKVTLDDAIQVAQIAVGAVKVNGVPKIADANGDGKIDMKDALLIARRANDTIKRLPADKSVELPDISL